MSSDVFMEKPIHRHNSVIFNYFASIITDFQLFAVSLHKIGCTQPFVSKLPWHLICTIFATSYNTTSYETVRRTIYQFVDRFRL